MLYDLINKDSYTTIKKSLSLSDLNTTLNTTQCYSYCSVIAKNNLNHDTLYHDTLYQPKNASDFRHC